MVQLDFVLIPKLTPAMPPYPNRSAKSNNGTCAPHSAEIETIRIDVSRVFTCAARIIGKKLHIARQANLDMLRKYERAFANGCLFIELQSPLDFGQLSTIKSIFAPLF